MSVTAEIETRTRTNALMVPIASVTTRIPKGKNSNEKQKPGNAQVASVAARTNSRPLIGGTNSLSSSSKKDAAKPIEVVFILEGDHVKMTPVKIGISDDTHWEVTEGLKEGEEVISGGFKAISRELEDGKKVKKGVVKEEDPNSRAEER